MKIYSSDQFYFHKDTNTMTADVSDLGGTASAMQRGWHLDEQVYNDAADSGFAIRSHRTGKLAIFTLKSTDEKEGEVRAWEYEAARKHESMMCSKNDIGPWDTYKNVKVTIFND